MNKEELLTPSATELLRNNPEEIKEIASYILCNQTDSVSGTIKKLFNHTVSKEWEVLEFKNKHSQRIYTMQNRSYAFDANLDEILKVKRLSDGLIFEVWQETNKGKIERFRIDGNYMSFIIHKLDKDYNYDLSELHPVEVFKDEER